MEEFKGIKEFKGKNYYQVLGVEQKASTTMIRKAYRKKALLYHPDKNPKDREKEAKQIFVIVGRAYETLSDKTKRLEYDKELKSSRSTTERKERTYENPYYAHETERKSGERDEELENFKKLFEAVNTLIEQWKEENKRKKDLGVRLVIEAKKKNWKKVDDLIKMGAKLNQQHPEDKLERSAIHFAVMQNNSVALQMLCETDVGSSRNNLYDSSIVNTCVDKNGNTALHYCVIFNAGECIEYLMTQGAKTFQQNHRNKDTPLHIAIDTDKKEFAMYLSQFNMDSGVFRSNHPSNMSHNQQDINGDTSLHLALKKGWKDVAQSLLKRGAETNIKNNRGFTASQNNYPLNVIPKPQADRTR